MSCWHVVEHSPYKGETNLMATRTDLSSVLTDREEEVLPPHPPLVWFTADTGPLTETQLAGPITHLPLSIQLPIVHPSIHPSSIFRQSSVHPPSFLSVYQYTNNDYL